MKLAYKVSVAPILSIIVFAAFAYLSFNTLKILQISGNLYNNIIQGKDILADVLPPPEYILESYLVAFEMSTEKDPSARNELIERFARLKKEYVDRHEYWMPREIEPGLKDALTKASYDPAMEFYKIAEEQLIPLVKAGDLKKASELVAGPLKQQYGEQRKAVDTVVTLATESSAKDEAVAAGMTSSKQKIMLTVFICGILLLIISTILSSISVNNIMTPVSNIAKVAGLMAQGDLSCKIEIGKRKDEIALLAEGINATCTELSKIISEIQENAEALAASSEEVSAISTELATGAEKITSQTTTIAGATEEMSTNIRTVDDAAGQMSLNTQTVSAAASQIAQNMETVASAAKESQSNINAMASASEEMTSTINEVAANAKKANDTTREAVDTVNQASLQVEELATAAQEINKIISVIIDIAEQTKLLALNATIEAARAGEAGKGFAVVAGEVKELAKQTNSATDDIKKRIMAMQNSTGLTVDKIKNISEVIQNVNEIVSTIAAAVEEQNVTMKENAQSVSLVAAGMQEVAKNVEHVNAGVNSITKSISESAEKADDVAKSAGEASKGAEDVTKNVNGISDAVKDTSQGAQQLNSAATDLANMASNLQEMMAKFKVNSNYSEKVSSPVRRNQSQKPPAATKKPITKGQLPSLDKL